MELLVGQDRYNIIEMELAIFVRGAWDIPYLRVADELDISVGTAVQVELFDKTLSGTVAEVVAFGGVTTFIIAAGTYKMKDIIESTNTYGGIVKDIVGQILNATGMKLSVNTDQSVLTTRFNRFDKIKASGTFILEKLLQLVPGAIWRIELDGSLYIGKETYTDISVKYPDAIENDTYIVRDKMSNEYNIFTMDMLFEPGFIIDGRKVQSIYFSALKDTQDTISKSQPGVTVTTIFSFLPPDYISSQELNSDMKEIIYGSTYRVTVLEQTSNTSFSVNLDDEYSDLFPGGLKDVPVAMTMPNMYFKVKPGAVGYMTFVNRSPTRPLITGWEHGQSDIISVYFADSNGTKVIARKLDGVSVGTLSGTAPPGGGPVTFTYKRYDNNARIIGEEIGLSGGQITGSTSVVESG